MGAVLTAMLLEYRRWSRHPDTRDDSRGTIYLTQSKLRMHHCYWCTVSPKFPYKNMRSEQLQVKLQDGVSVAEEARSKHFSDKWSYTSTYFPALLAFINPLSKRFLNLQYLMLKIAIRVTLVRTSTCRVKITGIGSDANRTLVKMLITTKDQPCESSIQVK
jgi:hypothetical protein